ncbi:hypothetical protein FKR81_28465 [Lentzea tibetensis]|uniref:3-hydroxybutyryl-CoA dehydrogenase n=1 Tax=Lentzea tibetensis TaxID=2591470 RepID=A0A563EMV3_9PSEU|nr:3-hydroxyacyl-CoA dehydrogenase family protein [Lentzea tibetensis]TWP48518.1 hypothetical protein FKR81_28465 [Lentzea tibetensis]
MDESVVVGMGAMGEGAVQVLPAPDHVGDLVRAHLDHAISLCEQGYASRADIDTAMRLGCGLPAGPLELAGYTGGPVRSATTARGSTREVARVGVVGSGTMACGITEVFATNGFPVTLVARTPARARSAFDVVDGSLARAMRRGRITDEVRESAISAVHVTTDLAELAECDLLIEAVAEDLDVKRTVLTAVDAVARPGAVLATSTSSLSVTACAAATSRPADVLGLHFFNPAPHMRLVEVVPAAGTAADVVATACSVVRGMGKEPIVCGDRAGFIVNYLLFPYLNDAVRLLDRCEPDAVDSEVVSRFGYPMGPFKLLDTIGLDVSLAILTRLDEEFPGAGHAPHERLVSLVARGRLGRKTGAGFYDWPVG